MKRYLIHLLTRQYIGIDGFVILIAFTGVLSVIAINFLGGNRL
jgi:hypothetical protein